MVHRPYATSTPLNIPLNASASMSPGANENKPGFSLTPHTVKIASEVNRSYDSELGVGKERSPQILSRWLANLFLDALRLLTGTKAFLRPFILDKPDHDILELRESTFAFFDEFLHPIYPINKPIILKLRQSSQLKHPHPTILSFRFAMLSLSFPGIPDDKEAAKTALYYLNKSWTTLEDARPANSLLACVTYILLVTGPLGYYLWGQAISSMLNHNPFSTPYFQRNPFLTWLVSRHFIQSSYQQSTYNLYNDCDDDNDLRQLLLLATLLRFTVCRDMEVGSQRQVFPDVPHWEDRTIDRCVLEEDVTYQIRDCSWWVITGRLHLSVAVCANCFLSMGGWQVIEGIILISFLLLLF